MFEGLNKSEEDKMGNKRLLVVVGLVITLGFFLLTSQGWAQSKAGSANKLTIGGIISLSGWFSAIDMAYWSEAIAAAQMINERGGVTIKGQKYDIEVIAEDNRSTIDGTAAAANKLVYDKGVKFIIGPPAFFSSAASPLLKQNKVVNILSWCTSQPGEMGPEAPYTFLGFNGPLGLLRASLSAMKKFNPNAKTACVVIPDDGGKPYVVPQIKKAFEEQGITTVGDTIAYPNEMVDFSPIVTKIAAIKSDLIIHVSGLQEHIAKITRGLRERGDFRPYGGAIYIDAKELSSVAGKELATNVYTNTLNANDPQSPPLMKEMVQRMRQKEPNRPYFFFAEANGLWILTKAMEAAQSLDPMVVKDKLEKMGTVETVFGPGTICGTNTYGIANHMIAHPQQVTLIEKGETKWSGWFNVKLP